MSNTTNQQHGNGLAHNCYAMILGIAISFFIVGCNQPEPKPLIKPPVKAPAKTLAKAPVKAPAKTLAKAPAKGPTVQDKSVVQDATAQSTAVTIATQHGQACEIKTLAKGAVLYRNRPHSFKSMPKSLAGLKFAALNSKAAINYTVTVNRDGLLLVLVPERFDSKPLIADGWQDTGERIPVSFDAKTMVVLKLDAVKGKTYFVGGTSWVNPILVSGSIAVK